VAAALTLYLMQRQQSLLVVIVIHTPIHAPSGAALYQRRGSIIFIRIRFCSSELAGCCWRADEQQASEREIVIMRNRLFCSLALGALSLSLAPTDGHCAFRARRE
jgi:hypothetical protein